MDAAAPSAAVEVGELLAGTAVVVGVALISDFVVLSHSAALHSEERRILRAMHEDNGVPAGDMLWTDVLDIVKLTVPMPLPFTAMSHGNRFHIPLKLISGPVFRQQVCDSAVEWSGRARLLSLFTKFRALNI